MIIRTINEWGSLPYGEDDGAIPRVLAERLLKASNASPIGKNGGQRIVSLGYDRLSVGQVVGIIAADGCVLEILPKIEGLVEGDLRRQLVHMLAVAYDLPIGTGRLSSLSVQSTTLLELLIRLFAERLTEIVRKGMPKNYARCDDDLPDLRGRLNIFRQYTVLATSPTKIACMYEEFSADIPLNQIMKAALFFLMRVARRDNIRRELSELAYLYDEVTDIPVSSLPWDRVHFDRRHDQWRPILEFARLLVGRQFQTTTAGEKSGYALLFEMNVLFERYVERMLADGMQGTNLSVVGQGGGLCCVTEIATDSPAFKTRPDILIRQGQEILMIIDAKWKRADTEFTSKNGITQSDIYQMMAYAQVYSCDKLVLIYPHTRDIGDIEGVFAQYRLAGTGAKLSATSIDISNVADIQHRLRRMVWPA